MNEMAITVSRAMTAPNYETTAAGLLEAARMFYQEPENEKAFQRWKTQKIGGQNGGTDHCRVCAG